MINLGKYVQHSETHPGNFLEFYINLDYSGFIYDLYKPGLYWVLFSFSVCSCEKRFKIRVCSGYSHHSHRKMSGGYHFSTINSLF